MTASNVLTQNHRGQLPMPTPLNSFVASTSEPISHGRIRPLSPYDILSIRELSEVTPYKYTWLLAACEWTEHALPTIKRGKRPTVLYGDFLDWLQELYGVGGRLRGTEILEHK